MASSTSRSWAELAEWRSRSRVAAPRLQVATVLEQRLRLLRPLQALRPRPELPALRGDVAFQDIRATVWSLIRSAERLAS